MKRVLILTYYWPPAGGPGVQRWLKFVTYLKEFGIEPIVFVPENPNYPLIDSEIISEVPKDIEVVKFPIKEPYKLAKLFSKKKTKKMSSGVIPSEKPSVLEKMMLYVRGNYFIPDARVGWVKPSVAFLKTYLSEQKIDTIVTSGPPHSLHLIGMELQKLIGVKWLADFRDPWTTIHYHASLRLKASSEKKHKTLEKQVLRAADRVVVTSPSTKKEFEAITEKPVKVITNGYEETEAVYPVLDDTFSLVHIGSLLSKRNPLVLWKVLQEIASEHSDFKKDLEIKLAGVVSEDVLKSITDFDLHHNVSNLGYVPHSKAIQLQHNAQVLLLVEMDTPETKAIIPGKFFEYLIAHRPIVALGPKGSDVETIMNLTKSGAYFSYADSENLKKTLLKYYQLFKEDSLTITSEGIKKYSRKALTKQMAGLLHEL
ncbi:glycosyltransferase family 4 protein [Jejudonia soesokkakensis]|uniref:Glycosyltransferase family 4 protein n=1 Tax=Jejudonia soesokkakensis TaxID=1323432 RepID=A0ABW2MTL8_9FLAO